MYQFGQYLKEVEEMKPYYEIAAAPYPEKSTDEQVIIAEIKNRKYVRLSLSTYSKAKVGMYLFRELAFPNATSIVPTLHFYFVPGDKALDASCDKFFNKLERSLDKNKGIYERFFDINTLKTGVREGFKGFVQSRFSEKKNYLFTLQIDDSWLGEIPEIKAILKKSSYDKYFRDSKGKMYLGENKTCAVTYEENLPEVWGRVDTLGFTVDSIAFSRNGFEATDSYKMFPVSPDAVKILEGTMRAIDRRLSFTFLSLKFFVLPHFVTLGDDMIRKKNITRLFVKKLTEPVLDGLDPLLNAIVGSEGIFSSIIEDPELGQNSIYYDIFFYEEKQAQFAIKLHVADVLPSRFRAIRDSKKQVTAFYRPITFKQFKNKDTFTFSPNLYHIKDYFAIKREKETIIEPYFFKIVEAIFYKNKIDKEQVLRAFMQKVVPAFKNVTSNSYSFSDHVKHSFCIYQFFQKLQLFDNMEQKTHESIAFSALDFIAQHEVFFEARLQKAAFLLGCAVEVLLGSQRSYLNGNEPFAKRLNNLNVGYLEMQRIQTELLSKVKQYSEAKKLYDSEYIQRLLVGFNLAMVEGDDASTTKTQISYAFSLGLVMEKEFTSQRIAERKDKKKQHAGSEPE